MNKKIRILFALIFLGIMAYAGWNLYNINTEYHEVEEVYDDLISQFVKIEEANDTDPAKPLQNQAETATEAPKVVISFEELLATYPDVIGWIYSEGTPINYPIVQGKDNDQYLRRLINGRYNIGGTIFMDYRNSEDFADLNTLIYGHNMKNGTMFGSLQKYMKQSYYDKHPTMQLRTPSKEYIIELICGYQTVADDEIYILPLTQEKRDELLTNGIEKSTFQSNVEVKPTDKLITFSTCINEIEDARYILIGRIIQK